MNDFDTFLEEKDCFTLFIWWDTHPRLDAEIVHFNKLSLAHTYCEEKRLSKRIIPSRVQESTGSF